LNRGRPNRPKNFLVAEMHTVEYADRGRDAHTIGQAILTVVEEFHALSQWSATSRRYRRPGPLRSLGDDHGGLRPVTMRLVDGQQLALLGEDCPRTFPFGAQRLQGEDAPMAHEDGNLVVHHALRQV